MPPITLVPIGTPMTRKGGVCSQHAAQMRGLARRRDDHAETVRSRVLCQLLGSGRGAVRRNDAHIKRDAEFRELVRAFAHHLEIAVRPHDDTNLFHKNPPNQKNISFDQNKMAGYLGILHIRHLHAEMPAPVPSFCFCFFKQTRPRSMTTLLPCSPFHTFTPLFYRQSPRVSSVSRPIFKNHRLAQNQTDICAWLCVFSYPLCASSPSSSRAAWTFWRSRSRSMAAVWRTSLSKAPVTHSSISGRSLVRRDLAQLDTGAAADVF